jgi:hypothetical protein
MSHTRRSSSSRAGSGPKAVAELVTAGAIADYARALDALDRRLRRQLPEAVAGECRLADVRNGRVVFLASSPAWAARLRLYQTALLREARTALGGAAERFAVKVAPLPPVPPEAAKRKPLSTTTARHLRATAKSLADPELRALYLRLASFAMDESP